MWRPLGNQVSKTRFIRDPLQNKYNVLSAHLLIKEERERERERGKKKKTRNKNVGCSYSKIEIGVGGFQVSMGGFSSAWAVCGCGAWVAVGGCWYSWLAVGQVQIAMG